uniref:Uncharacterized protein n=1 Tax=Anguilla anguilla TaxID=7936 RepID=A0A0E9UGV9_ANGAN
MQSFKAFLLKKQD